ncbi:MAG: hypothetical protein IT462_13600 [Planctomycetes bacterium]|nr:hypothetical protein [Planctomycetota bacterium]
MRRVDGATPSDGTKLREQAKEIHGELGKIRNEQQEALALLKERLEATRAEMESAVFDRERLMKEMNAITEQATGKPTDKLEANDGSATIAIINARDAINAKLAAKTRIARRDEDIQRSKGELDELAKELAAAEELLKESDAQRDELDKRLSDQDKELWKLRAQVQGAQSHAQQSRLKTMMLTRSHVKRGEHTLRLIEEMLKRWIKSDGEAKVTFSEHGHASDVRAAFEKIDRDFIDRFFTLVTNPEYERGQHRVIRIKDGKDPDGSPYGELVIALDDDAGRTLGLRFDLRKDAPDATQVGFMLAMMLKALSREYRDYGVK